MHHDLPFLLSRQVGPFVFVSGKVGVDPASGEIAKGDVKAQTHQIFTNMSTELAQYGLDLSSVVKTTVFLTDMRQFEAMNEAYRANLTEPLPTRSCVSVSGLPHVDALVEIELIAYTEG